jgi:hypothetical protein
LTSERGLSERVGVDVVGNNDGTMLREYQRNLAADASTGTGHHRHTSRESIHQHIIARHTKRDSGHRRPYDRPLCNRYEWASWARA